MSIYYAIVDRPGEEPRRQQIMVASRHASSEGGIVKPERVAPLLKPTPMGLYVLNEKGEFYKESVAALKDKMERENLPGEAPHLLGPFKTEEAAFTAVHEARPKTEAESQYEKGLAIGIAKGDEEKSALRARIEELEKKTK